MKLSELRVACPSCGSQEVAYTCQPDCCFNHVCESCLASFELATELLEGASISNRALALSQAAHWRADRTAHWRLDESVETPIREEDSCRPTAACARCRGLNVYQMPQDSGEDLLACADCRALLRLV